MLSKNEMKALINVNDGADDVQTLSGVMEISRPQTYKIVKSLSEKDLAELKHGRIILDNKPHIAILLEIIQDIPTSVEVLADSGLDIIGNLKEPHTVSEISDITGLHQTTITRKIDGMRRRGMLRKNNSTYSINRDIWPKLYDFACAYESYRRTSDPRIPFGANVHFISKRLAVFSDKRQFDITRTAFSMYGDFGIAMFPGTNYYCTLKSEPGIEDVFLHSLYVVDSEKSWRNKMLALIFYVKHKDLLTEVKHPIIDDMDAVLSGKRIDGWVPLWEMQERAEMYGVNLYDN